MPKNRQSARVRIAPALKAALDSIKTGTKPLAVVYQLKGSPGQIVPPPAMVDQMVDKVIGNAAREANVGPQRRNTFRHMGSFVVLGNPDFHRAVLKQPEIQAAVLNSSGASDSSARAAMGARSEKKSGMARRPGRQLRGTVK